MKYVIITRVLLVITLIIICSTEQIKSRFELIPNESRSTPEKSNLTYEFNFKIDSSKTKVQNAPWYKFKN